MCAAQSVAGLFRWTLLFGPRNTSEYAHCDGARQRVIQLTTIVFAAEKQVPVANESIVRSAPRDLEVAAQGHAIDAELLDAIQYLPVTQTLRVHPVIGLHRHLIALAEGDVPHLKFRWHKLGYLALIKYGNNVDRIDPRDRFGGTTSDSGQQAQKRKTVHEVLLAGFKDLKN